MKDSVKIKGMFRVQLTEDGKVVGDSGWHENMITNDGFNQYLVRHLGGDTDRKSITHMAIGTGTAPASDATSLAGEITTDAGRIAVSSSSVASHTYQATAQWASSLHTGTHTIQNLGLFNTESGGTIFAGNTFATSQWNSNQDVNATYQIRFATA